MIDKKLEFWDSRAGLGEEAGSNDIVAKKLEVNALRKHLKDGLKVLEIGCGNGVTSRRFATDFDVEILAVDFSSEMIKFAKQDLDESKHDMKGTVDYQVLNIDDLEKLEDKFDLIYTERVLINLNSWEEQKTALKNISRLLNDGGVYCMCENSLDGLEKINEYRLAIGLERILPPWHNVYFNEKDVLEFSKTGVMELKEIDCFSSTYYFISRVINASEAKRINDDPKYDAPMNLLSLDLPGIGDFGQSKLWVWGKPSSNLLQK